MGHQRPGATPNTREWRAVVTLLAESTGGGPAENVEAIAAQALQAADAALQQAKSDVGVRYTFYLLTQIVAAARHEDWQSRLAAVGIQLDDKASVFDLGAEMQSAVDSYISRHGHATDLSEMAQQAAGEAMASLAGSRAVSLFGSGNDEMRTAIRELSTKAGFSRLGQTFFGSFVSRFLNFYLSRVTARQVGAPRLPNVEAVSEFNRALSAHCEESARIVRDFCGGWYSKTDYVEGINVHNTSRFMAVALSKLQRELARQRAQR